MKKKLLPLVLGSLLATYYFTLTPIKAQGTPRITPQEFNKDRPITPLCLGDGYALKFLELYDGHAAEEEGADIICPFPLNPIRFTAREDQIRSRVGSNFIHLYKNFGDTSNAPLVIFRSPEGKYIAYCSNAHEADNRNKVVFDVENSKNVDIIGIDQLLSFTKNVILELNH